MASGGGCPLGYDKAAAGSAEQHAAQAARRVEGLIFDAVEREAALGMDACRTRVAAAPKIVRGLWALGLSHELLPCGRGHCSPEAKGCRLAAARAKTVRDTVAVRCDQPGLRDRLSHCPRGEQACVTRQLEAFVRCAKRVVSAAAAATPATAAAGPPR